MDEWVIGLDAWIIQDGNYGDFERGQHADFAVELWSERGLRISAEDDTSAELERDCRYRIRGEVVYTFDEPRTSAWVVDFGISAFTSQERPSGAHRGVPLAGEVDLGIDPYDYFESLYAIPGMPALIYRWRIDRIERQSAPFVEVAPRHFERDRAALAWNEVERTDAWKDDAGYAEYLLHCTLLDDTPSRKRGR